MTAAFVGMVGGVLGQQAPPAGGVTIGPINFETGEGYTDGNDLSSYTTIWKVRRESGSSGTGVPRLDDHSDHGGAGLCVDSSAVGSNFCVHQTELSGSNHYAQCDVFTDTGSGTTTCANQLGVLLRGSTDGGSAWSGYAVTLRRSGSVDTFIEIRRCVADDHDTEVCFTSANIDDTYFSDDEHTLKAEISGDIIKVWVDGNLEVTHDTGTDTAKISTGTYTGMFVGRQYTGTGTNAQPFVDDFSAADL